MTLSHPEQIDNRHLQTKQPDTAEHFEFASETLLPELAGHQQSSGTPQFPYGARYTSHCTPVGSINGSGRPSAKIVKPPPSMVPVSVPFQQAVMYPGYSSCAVYPTATRGSYSCLNRHSSEASEGHALDLHSHSEGTQQDDTPDSQSGQREVCRYFMRTGTCGYGDKCRYHHPQSARRPKLNSMGYPQREAEHACPFYLKNGWCGFGATCKFNHPELPPLNVPVTTMMPHQVLTHVSYSTVPPYANVPAGSAYPIGTAPPMIPWPVPATGVAVNVPIPATQQNGHSRSYMSTAVPSTPWIGKSEDCSLKVESYGNLNSDVAPNYYGRKGSSPSPKDSVKRRMSPGSEDSAYSVMGQDVSLPLHSFREDSKHVLISGARRDETSRVSVTNP